MFCVINVDGRITATSREPFDLTNKLYGHDRTLGYIYHSGQSYEIFSLSTKLILAEWAIECVKRVLPIWNEYNPRDHRPEQALKAATQWLTNPTDKNRLAIKNVAVYYNGFQEVPEYMVANAAWFAANSVIHSSDLYNTECALNAVRNAYLATEDKEYERQIQKQILLEICKKYLNDFVLDQMTTFALHEKFPEDLYPNIYEYLRRY